MKKLIGKIIINGTIEVVTGLSIGGNKSGIDIGGKDNPVIKIRKGNNEQPYIPGSSLKGKLRSLLAKVAGTENVKQDVALIKNGGDYGELAIVFGYGANEEKSEQKEGGEALLKVRDAYIYNMGEKTEFTEDKTENTINRLTGDANPRSLERVLPETKFELDMCLDVYDENSAEKHLQLISLGIKLLNNDYLGGGGTRGNGRIKVTPSISHYYKVSDVDLVECRESEKLDSLNKIIQENQ